MRSKRKVCRHTRRDHFARQLRLRERGRHGAAGRRLCKLLRRHAPCAQRQELVRQLQGQQRHPFRCCSAYSGYTASQGERNISCLCFLRLTVRQLHRCLLLFAE